MITYTCPNCGTYVGKQELIIPANCIILFSFVAHDVSNYSYDFKDAARGNSIGFLMPDDTYSMFVFHQLNYL